MNPPRLMDQVRDALRVHHYSLRTEQSYSSGSSALFCSTTSATRGTWARPGLPHS